MAAVDPRGSLDLRDVRPVVPLPPSGLPVAVLLIIALGLALALFFALDARRRAMVEQSNRPRTETGQVIGSPAPLAVPPEPPPPPVEAEPDLSPAPRQSTPTEFRPPTFSSPPAFSPPASPPPQNPPPQAVAAPRSDAPVLVVDTTVGAGGTLASSDGKSTAGVADNDEAIRATVIRNRSALVPQGTLIRAVLETPLNSSRPGLARAVVSRDALSFDGSRILIPRGSRLIGEFQADAGSDARRVLVTWTRLIRPDGVAIRIGSPAGDALGGAGIAGRVNTHFFERFANAVLQSALIVGVSLASQPTNGNSVFVALPGQAATLGQQLLPNINPRVTIKVRQGTEISIFVARDLDFGGTPPVQ